MPYCQAKDGVKLYYTHTPGEKTTVVFIHGWALNSSVWKQETEAVRNLGHSVITVDLRGHGSSSWADKDVTIEDFSNDILCVLHTCNTKHCVLVGHSFGGMISLYFAARHKKYVCGLVVLDASSKSPLLYSKFSATVPVPFVKKTLSFLALRSPEFKTKLPGLDFSKFTNDESSIYYFLKGATHTRFSALLFVLQIMLDYDEQAMLPNIDVPTVVVVGEEDKRTPVQAARDIVSKIRNAKLKVIKNAHHDTPLTSSDEVIQIVCNYLQTERFKKEYW